MSQAEGAAQASLGMGDLSGDFDGLPGLAYLEGIATVPIRLMNAR